MAGGVSGSSAAGAAAAGASDDEAQHDAPGSPSSPTPGAAAAAASQPDPAHAQQQQHHQPLRTATGAMNPDHPMRQRAQRALGRQLAAKRMRVEGELRERQTALQRAKKQREEVGVELYGFQQTLAKLQLSLEKAQGNYQSLAEARVQAEQEVAQLRTQLEQSQATTKQEEQRAEAVQRELDRLGVTLRQVEAYNASARGEIAVARRAAHAAEDAMQKLEKEKQQQDYLINGLQERMRLLQQQLALYEAQLLEQRHETRAAHETLAQAAGDMEAVHFEKKQLLAQWRGSLVAIQRRDEALAAIQASITKQQEQEQAIETELHGYARDAAREQARSEQLGGVVRRVQGECGYVLRQATSSAEKHQALAAQLAQLTSSLEQMEQRIRTSTQEAKALAGEAASVERVTQRAAADIRSLEAELLRALGDATSAEKSSAKTAADIRGLRQAAKAEEPLIAQLQNELARLGVDALNTQGHNERLRAALQLLDAELQEKDATIAKCEVELKRRTDEIERKTRDTDALNRRLEKLLAAQPEAINRGPLEATIHNLGREMEAKGREGQELQRRWIARQTELVPLQAENNSLTEAIARHKGEVTVLLQKRARVQQALQAHEKQARALKAAAQRLQVDLNRINALIAQNTSLKAMLEEEHLQLEGRALSKLRSLEESSASLAAAIQDAQLAKRQLLDELLDAERQMMLVQRKTQLEREMQEMLDPSVGESVVATMRSEVHRMELRHAELLRLQERLLQALEKALSKHEIVGVRALAQRAKSGSGRGSSPSPAAGRAGATTASTGSATSGASGPGGRVIADLKRSIQGTDAEAAAAAARLEVLQKTQQQLQERTTAAAGTWQQLQEQRDEFGRQTAAALAARQQSLLATSQLQGLAKLMEGALSGPGGKAADHAGSRLEPKAAGAELAGAIERQAQLAALVRSVQQELPGLAGELNRVLAHAAATTAWAPAPPSCLATGDSSLSAGM